MTDATTAVAPTEKSEMMARLKSATDEHHRRAEGRQLQQDLFKGVLPREKYAAYLGELLHIHHRLEQRLDELAEGHTELAAVYREHYARSADLRADLAFHGGEPGPEIEATATLLSDIDRWARESPTALLGPLYVLEGSMNGNQFIARVLMKAWELAPGPGLRYLSPYGEKQPAMWAQFKADMNAQVFSDGDEEAVIAAARRTFDAIAEVADAVIAAG